MDNNESEKKLQDIVGGALLEGQEDHCSAVRNLLCQRFGSNPTTKSNFESRAILKEKQARFLKSFAVECQLWLPALPSGCRYLTRGGEAKIYLAADS
jgi:hypothetical protein